MSINKIKQIAKKMLNEDVDVINSSYDTNNFSKSLKQFTDDNPSLLEEYSQFGKRKDGKEFYPEIKKIEKGFYLLNKDLHVYDHPGFVLPNEIHTVRTGSPMRTKPFPMAREYIIKMLMGKYLYQYPNIGGHVIARAHFVNYLIKEGFKKDKTENYDGLGVENVVFSCSTTHAFNMILSTIMKDEDVVIVTGPNYGLFAVDPERMNGRVEVLDLEEEDNFYVNPIKLAQKIDTINERLKQDFKDKLNYTPRVVAFLNMNPHNPLGKVMNKKNVEILKGIGDVCLEKGVFVIDDLIYRDLTYDQEDLALPLATMPKYFNNTITLLGLSKAYGLAGIRAGAIVAPIPICKGNEEKIFSANYACPDCSISLEELSPRMFSFNTPYGACKECMGIGELMSIDPDRIVPDKEKRLCDPSLIHCWSGSTTDSISLMYIRGLCEHYNVDINTKYKDLPKDFLNVLLYGSNGEKIKFSHITKTLSRNFEAEFEGVVNILERRYIETKSNGMKAFYQQYMSSTPCQKCNGARLKKESLSVTFGNLNIYELCKKDIAYIKKYVNDNFEKLSEKNKMIAGQIVKELNSRLQFLIDVGLDYLTLARSAATLSGGEAQRIRLATQIGSGLTGVLYVLDEPSIGLHQRDNEKLIATLKKQGIDFDADIVSFLNGFAHSMTLRVKLHKDSPFWPPQQIP